MKFLKRDLADPGVMIKSLGYLRRTFYTGLLRDLTLFGGIAMMAGARYAATRSNSELYSVILSVSVTLLSILSFALATLAARALRREEIFKLLKSRHTEFFAWVGSDVAHLIEKGRIHERPLTGSYQ